MAGLREEYTRCQPRLTALSVLLADRGGGLASRMDRVCDRMYDVELLPNG